VGSKCLENCEKLSIKVSKNLKNANQHIKAHNKNGDPSLTTVCLGCSLSADEGGAEI
jgi:hypothetical protein